MPQLQVCLPTLKLASIGELTLVVNRVTQPLTVRSPVLLPMLRVRFAKKVSWEQILHYE